MAIRGAGLTACGKGETVVCWCCGVGVADVVPLVITMLIGRLPLVVVWIVVRWLGLACAGSGSVVGSGFVSGSLTGVCLVSWVFVGSVSCGVEVEAGVVVGVAAVEGVGCGAMRFNFPSSTIICFKLSGFGVAAESSLSPTRAWLSGGFGLFVLDFDFWFCFVGNFELAEVGAVAVVSCVGC